MLNLAMSNVTEGSNLDAVGLALLAETDLVGEHHLLPMADGLASDFAGRRRVRTRDGSVPALAGLATVIELVPVLVDFGGMVARPNVWVTVHFSVAAVASLSVDEGSISVLEALSPVMARKWSSPTFRVAVVAGARETGVVDEALAMRHGDLVAAVAEVSEAFPVLRYARRLSALADAVTVVFVDPVAVVVDLPVDVTSRDFVVTVNVPVVASADSLELIEEVLPVPVELATVQFAPSRNGETVSLPVETSTLLSVVFLEASGLEEGSVIEHTRLWL